jgi:hypothetical protein
MTDKEATPNSPFDHPDVARLFEELFPVLVDESDRGAVLIAAAQVDNQLRMLFEQIAPSDFGKKALERVMEYPGALSSLAAKADTARMSHLISKHVYDSIYYLRKMRNDVAHGPESFRLKDHEDRIRKVYELGPNLPISINRLANELMVQGLIGDVLQIQNPSDDTKPAFANPREVIDYLSSKPALMAPLEEKRPRWELAIGATLLCAIIIFERDAARQRLTAAESQTPKFVPQICP